MAGISARLPLALDADDGIALNKTYEAVIRQNLIALLLTVPGERIMIPEFGVGMKRFLFEQDNILTRQEISAKVREQVGRFLSVVEIVNIFFESERDNPLINPNTLHIRFEYNIIPLDEIDSLTLVVDEEAQTVNVMTDDLTTII